MAEIVQKITLIDGVSPILRKIVAELNKLENSVKRISTQSANIINKTALSTSNRTIEKTTVLLDKLKQGERHLAKLVSNTNKQVSLTQQLKRILLDRIKRIKPAIDRNASSQQRWNSYIRGGLNETNRFLSSLTKAASIYASLKGLGTVLNTADSMVTTKARLDLVNDGNQSTDELHEMIYQSAMNARSGYAETADVVAKLATRAGQVFDTTQETVAFANTLQKMFHLAGASTQEMYSASLQLTQALGSGVLRGEELNAVFEAAPNVIHAIADYMNVPIGQIRKMAKDGEITADIIKNAMFAAANDVNEKFAQMPVTWAQVWTIIKNFTLKVFTPILQAISAITSSDRFIGFVDSLGKAMKTIANIVTWVFEKISNFAAYVYDNWKTLRPAIMSVVGAFVAFNATLIVSKTVAAAYNTAMGIATARHLRLAGATFATTIQQTSLNSALLACPWVWVVGGLMILIGAIGSCMLATYDWENSNIDVLATIKNIFSEIGQFLRDTVLAAWEKLKDVGDQVKDVLADVGDTIKNNWSGISSIIAGVVAAYAAYAIIVGVVTVATTIYTGVVAAYNAVKAIAIFLKGFYTGLTFKEAAALTWLAACEWAANLPLVAKIVLIGLIIAAIAWLVVKILEWCGITVSATGIIFGAVAWLAATIWNIVVGLWNGILQLLDAVVDQIIGVVEWILNVCNGGFNSFGDAVANLIGNIISWFLSLGQVVTKIIDAIFGTNWTAGLESLKSSVLAWGGKNENSITLERGYLSRNAALDRVNATDWYNSGYKLGEGVENSLSNLSIDGIGDKIGGLTNGLGEWAGDLIVTKSPDGGGEVADPASAVSKGVDNPAGRDYARQIAGDTKDIANNTGTTADNTGNSDEHFKYLRQMADRNSMNRNQLMNFKVDMSNVNHIRSGLDADEVMRRLARELYHEIVGKLDGAEAY